MLPWPILKSQAQIIRKTWVASPSLMWALSIFSLQQVLPACPGSHGGDVRAKDWFSQFAETRTRISHSNWIQTWWNKVHKTNVWRQQTQTQMSKGALLLPGPAARCAADPHHSCQLSEIPGCRLESLRCALAPPLTTGSSISQFPSKSQFP